MTTRRDEELPHDEVEVGEDSTWTDGSTTFRIVGMTIEDDELLISVWAGRDDYRTMTIREVIKSMVECKWVTAPELVRRADDDELLATLPDDKYDRVEELERAILEATTGFPTLVPLPGAEPRPAYDPSRVGKTQRIRDMAAEVGLKKSRLYELINAYDDRGRAGLVHGNTKTTSQLLSTYDDETKEFVRGFIARQIGRGTKTRGNLKALLLDEMVEAGFPPHSSYQLDRLLNELSRGKSLFGDATTRRSKDNRPDTGGVRPRTSRYGTKVEADASPMDFLVWSPVGQEWLNVWGIFLTCTATKISSARLTTSPPNSRAFALALARMMLPPTLPDVQRPWHFAPIAPKAIEFPRNQWPAIIPGELHIDHGKEGENGHIWDICARLDISLTVTRPRTPTDKPEIESMISTVQKFTQLLPGHKGNAVKNRGEHPEREALLTLSAAQAVMDEVCLQTMYQPHSGLPHPHDPSRFLTPAQAYNNSITSRRSRSKANPNLVFELLEPVQAVVSGNDVTVGPIVYRADDPSVMRAISAGDRHVRSRSLIFRRDNNDMSRLFWHEPGSARWHVLRAVHQGTTLPPFSDVTYTRLLKEIPHRRLNKQQQLDLAAAFRKHIRTLEKSKAGRNELAREFARVYESVPDPVPVPPKGAASPDVRPAPDGQVERPSFTLITGEADKVSDSEPQASYPSPLPAVPPDLAIADDDGCDPDDYEMADFTDDDFTGGGW